MLLQLHKHTASPHTWHLGDTPHLREDVTGLQLALHRDIAASTASGWMLFVHSGNVRMP
jgi:hypothetical protein